MSSVRMYVRMCISISAIYTHTHYITNIIRLIFMYHLLMANLPFTDLCLIHLYSAYTISCVSQSSHNRVRVFACVCFQGVITVDKAYTCRALIEGYIGIE